MKNKIKTKREFSIYELIFGIILIVYSVSFILPIIWGLITSFKASTDFESGNILGLPDLNDWAIFKERYLSNPKKYASYADYTHIFGNYHRMFSNLEFPFVVAYRRGFNLQHAVSESIVLGLGDFILNSLLYSFGTSIAAALAPCMMGYLCSKYKYKFCDIIYTVVIFVMVTPIVGTQSAMIDLMRRLSLYDTVLGMFLKQMNFAGMYFLIFYAFFSSIPDAYTEAASIDGASQFRIMFLIYMPLAIKMISTVFLLQFVIHWNGYNDCLIYFPSYRTLAFAVWFMTSGQASRNDTVPFQLASAMALALPMIIAFCIFKDRLMGSLTVGGVKG